MAITTTITTTTAPAREGSMCQMVIVVEEGEERERIRGGRQLGMEGTWKEREGVYASPTQPGFIAAHSNNTLALHVRIIQRHMCTCMMHMTHTPHHPPTHWLLAGNTPC